MLHGLWNDMFNCDCIDITYTPQSYLPPIRPHVYYYEILISMHFIKHFYDLYINIAISFMQPVMEYGHDLFIMRSGLDDISMA